MHRVVVRVLVPVVLATAAALPILLGAQSAVPLTAAPITPPRVAAPTGQIVVSATEEVEVTPDRARLTLAIETRAHTAAQAGSDNARIQTAILDTLAKLGIPAAQLQTVGVSVQPEYEYPTQGGRPIVVGYVARNGVRAELRRIALIGTVMDAGLAKGANRVDGLEFFASNTEQVRRDALKAAVQRARLDADAMATAAGGRIVGVIELTTGAPVTPQMEFGPQLMMARGAAAADTPTPIEAGTIKVVVTVVARFAYGG
ncbi:MAG: SIMPL domain-containing protein [Gemmatimonadota bacterium]